MHFINFFILFNFFSSDLFGNVNSCIKDDTAKTYKMFKNKIHFLSKVQIINLNKFQSKFIETYIFVKLTVNEVISVYDSSIKYKVRGETLYFTVIYIKHNIQ